MDKEKQFDLAIRAMIQTVLRDTTYKPRLFMEMVAKHGATDACLQLLRTKQPSEGFTRLWEMGRLDLTAEAHMLRPEFSDYFSQDDLLAARKRLRAYGYRASKQC